MNSTPAEKYGSNYTNKEYINQKNLRSKDLPPNSTLNPTPNLASNPAIGKLEYIFDMLRELRKIAKDTGEESLVYYLEMAAMESGEICDVIKFRQETVFAQDSKVTSEQT